ncbi:hypothetical protein LQK93_03820 [Terrabacter sp. BE26]
MTLFEFIIGFAAPPLALVGLPVFLGYVIFRLIKPKEAQADDARDHGDPRVCRRSAWPHLKNSQRHERALGWAR